MVTTTRTVVIGAAHQLFIQAESLWLKAGVYTSGITKRGNWDGSSDSEEETETRNKEDSSPH